MVVYFNSSMPVDFTSNNCILVVFDKIGFESTHRNINVVSWKKLKDKKQMAFPFSMPTHVQRYFFQSLTSHGWPVFTEHCYMPGTDTWVLFCVGWGWFPFLKWTFSLCEGLISFYINCLIPAVFAYFFSGAYHLWNVVTWYIFRVQSGFIYARFFVKGSITGIRPVGPF